MCVLLCFIYLKHLWHCDRPNSLWWCGAPILAAPEFAFGGPSSRPDARNQHRPDLISDHSPGYFSTRFLYKISEKNKKMTLLQRSTFVCLTKLAKLDFLRILISVCGLPALTENTSFRPLLIDISPHCHLMEYRDPNHPNWVICWWRIHGFGSVRKPSISYYPKHAMSI